MNCSSPVRGRVIAEKIVVQITQHNNRNLFVGTWLGCCNNTVTRKQEIIHRASRVRKVNIDKQDIPANSLEAHADVRIPNLKGRPSDPILHAENQASEASLREA